MPRGHNGRPERALLRFYSSVSLPPARARLTAAAPVAAQAMVREGARILGVVAERDDSDPRALLAELFQRIARYKGKLWPE